MNSKIKLFFSKYINFIYGMMIPLVLISLMCFFGWIVGKTILYIDVASKKQLEQGEVYGYVTAKLKIDGTTDHFLVINNIKYRCNRNIVNFHFIHGNKPVILCYRELSKDIREGTAIGEYK